MTKQQYLMTCAMEECNELAHRFSKAIRFGLKEVQSGQELNNEQRIVYEFIDLITIIGMLNFDEKYEHINESDVGKMVNDKVFKVEKYLEYSRSLGIVE